MTEEMKGIVETAVTTGENLGVDVIIVRGIENIENQIRFSQNKIDINKQWSSRILELCVVVNENQLATGEFSPSSDEKIRNQIRKIVDFAHKMAPSPFFMGIETKISSYTRLEEGYDNNIADYREKAPDSVNATINAAIESGAKRVAGSFLYGEKYTYLKTSAGLKGSYLGTYYNMTVRAFQEELDASGQGLACGRIPSASLDKLILAGNNAGRFSTLHKGAQQAEPGYYDVVMSPAVAANLLGNIPVMANPIMIMMGMSALGDKVGERLAPDFVSVNDDGIIIDGLGSSPFDVEGTPRTQTPIIKDGILMGFIHNTSTGKMAGGESTGNGDFVDIGIGSKFLSPSTTNCIFNNGDQSFEELLETSNPAIYVTCNWYTRYTSQISTEYSTIPRDAAFLIENGELSTPIKNFRISDNLLRQFANIDAMANDRTQIKWWEVQAPTFIPHIRVKNCHITTATK